MNPAALYRRYSHFTFAKGVVLFAVLCGFVLFHFRDSARKPTGKRHLFTVAATVAPRAPQAHSKSVSHPPVVVAPRTTAPFIAVKPAAKIAATKITRLAPVHPHHKRHLKKRIAKAKRAAIRKVITDLDQPEPKWLDESLASEDNQDASDSDQAVDLFDTATEDLQQALNEPSQVEDIALPSTIPWQFDQNFLADREIPAVQPYGEFAPHYIRNQFSEIKDRLATLREQAGTLPSLTPLPESKIDVAETGPTEIKAAEKTGAQAQVPVVQATSTPKQAVAVPTATPEPMPIVDLQAESPRSADVSDAKGTTVAMTAAPVAAETTETSVNTEPVLVDKSSAPSEAASGAMQASAGTAASVVVAAASPVLAAPTLVTHLEPVLVAPPPHPQLTTRNPNTQPTLVRPDTHPANPKPEPEPELASRTPPAKPNQAAVPPTTTHSASAFGATSVAANAPAKFFISHSSRPPGTPQRDDNRVIDEMLYGEIAVDDELSRWLVANKAHIELNLRAIGSRNPQDTVYIDYQYPASEFQMDTREMKGSYRLLADIYTAKSRAPYAQVVYATPISAETAKEKVRFDLRLRDVEGNKLASPMRRKNLVLSGALFEGASGDYRAPKAIAQGQIQVVGFPEWGNFRTEADGSFHIPNVPSESELLLQVQANGFYPTYKTIPTFASSPYSPVYLISKDKVDFITRYFTHHPQKGNFGLVMGRVFDPVTRVPLKEERLSLSFRRGAPIYFGSLGALPMVPGSGPADDLATTDNGMFAFFNLHPSMRSLNRESGKPSLLLDVHPQSADYIELGRGGLRNIRGRVLDRKMPVPAKVRLVGDKRLETETDADGNFVLSGVDLPPGAVTLEVEARGYPLTWQTISWNPREPESSHSLYMIEKDLIYEGAASNARVQIDTRLGLLIGQNAVFPKQTNCVYVSLVDADGRKVSSAQGPFSLLTQSDDPSQKLCLTRRSPWFSYFNLNPGEYVLKLTQQNGLPVRTHVVRVGVDRVSISVN